jgi:hypothetical protein
MVKPQDLNIRGSTQPEVFRSTVDAMARALRSDADRFWHDSVARDGPIDVWEIGGERFLFNGNHRYQAAVQEGVDIPDFAVRVVDMTGTSIPTFPLDKLTWLPGFK